GARIGGGNRSRRRAGVPIIDGRMILQAGICRGPGGTANLVPELARLHDLMRSSVETPGQGPLSILLDRPQKIVAYAHGIVRVLAGDGEIGFRIPVGCKSLEIDLRISLARQL